MFKKERIKTKLKVDDIVNVISGKDRRKQGKIISIDFYRGRVIVEGVNKVKKTVKKTQENQTGGFITREQPIHISNVMFFDSSLGRRVRMGYRINDEKKKERFSKSFNKLKIKEEKK